MAKPCSVCKHEAAGELAKAILAGVPFRELAFRYQLSLGSLSRHKAKCLQQTPRTQNTKRFARAHGSASSVAPFRSERAEDAEATTPEALLRRAERLLSLAEGIAASAQASDDARLALMAVDRASKALELLMKAHNMLGSDAANVVVTLNAEQRHVQTFSEALQAVLTEIPERERATLLRAFLAARDSAAPVIEGDFRALSP